ncbi:hypothetical protein [Streptomyces sp. B93]|uniref:hypothetical protein n=1 Tax=Streptomyces sp. B93 TaxID=2824875 RepID=UPI001B3973E0|nr:hypothetical protein [Streptomyces sp. B93]MBQ1093074.1 hypothetical protein [Streptomyces sp. B93]
MNSLTKIGAFGTALAATFAAAYGIGNAVSPVDTAPDKAAHASAEHAPASKPAADTSPGGLQIAADGYALDLRTPQVKAGEKSTLRFVVRGADGRPVTDYRVEHEKELHLIVASRDLTTYRHLHPVRAEDGTWSTTTTLPDPGGYRVLADFTPAAEEEGLTLGADLAVSGTYEPAALPAASRTATVDGYTVELNGDLSAGRESDLTFTVRRDGRPVTTLQPYLGAYGHLVALRSGDLAYLHVHPHEEAHGDETSGPRVAFATTAPSSGSYRLFLDFKADGEVRTAAFTVHLDSGAGQPRPEPEEHEKETPGSTHGH